MSDNEIMITVLLALFVCQAVYWKLTDPRSKTERLQELFFYKRGLYYILLIILVTSLVASAEYFPLSYEAFEVPVIAASLWVFILGMILAFWAKITMNRVWAPPGGLDTTRQNELKTDGPFRFTRNPIYVGLLMSLTGFTFAIHSSAFIGILFLYYYFVRAVSREEPLLLKHFGEPYRVYLQKVPRFL